MVYQGQSEVLYLNKNQSLAKLTLKQKANNATQSEEQKLCIFCNLELQYVTPCGVNLTINFILNNNT